MPDLFGGRHGDLRRAFDAGFDAGRRFGYLEADVQRSDQEGLRRLADVLDSTRGGPWVVVRLSEREQGWAAHSVRRQAGGCVAKFYGPKAEARAQAHARALNEEEVA